MLPEAPTRPLRVALITRDLMMGGAQQHIVKLCETAPRDEVALSLFLTVADAPRDLLANIPLDVPVHFSPYRRHHPLVLRWLAAGLARERAEVAHSFLWAADAFACLSRLAFGGPPLICSERGDRGYASYKGPYKLYDQLVTFRSAERYCANSHFGARMLAGYGAPRERLLTIHNGVDLERLDAAPREDLRAMLGWPEGCTIVGVVSRLIWYKGNDVLIRALAQVKGDHDLRCVLVGDGPQRGELEQLAADLGVAGRVAFLGTRSPSAPLIKDFDLAALATNTEHCSNTILEYMACGKAVVATEVGGNPELIAAGKTGILVPPRDPAYLARVLEGLLQQPALIAHMGREGRRRIEREFRQEHVTEQFVRLWRETARRPSSVQRALA